MKDLVVCYHILETIRCMIRKDKTLFEIMDYIKEQQQEIAKTIDKFEKDSNEQN